MAEVNPNTVCRGAATVHLSSLTDADLQSLEPASCGARATFKLMDDSWS